MTSKTEGHRDRLAPMIAALLPSKQYVQHIYDEEWEWFSVINVLNVVQNLVQLESFCGFLPIRKGSKAPMVCYKDKPHSPLLAALRKKPAALAIRSRNLLTLDLDKEEAFYFLESIGIDVIHLKTWCIWRSDNPLRVKIVFYVSDQLLLELPDQEIKRTINYKNKGLDVFLTNKGYILFAGEHEDGKGYYYCPENHGIAALAPPPKEIWDLVLEIAASEQTSPEKTYSSTTSKRLNPCPLCSRNERLWCSENPDGSIFCMNGSTFSAEKSHGPLTISQVVNTSSGKYAVASISAPCTTFKPHQERRTYRPHRTTRSKTNIRRAF